jgi:hypothetical protein
VRDSGTIRAVDDETLARCIDRAKSQVVYVAPGLGKSVAEALIRAISQPGLAVTIILDSDEDAYRIGYGEPEALAMLHEAVVRENFPLRRQLGLRIGLLVEDTELVIWTPTARSVEPERVQEQPNAIFLTGAPVHSIMAAANADGVDRELEHEGIGPELLAPEELQQTTMAAAIVGDQELKHAEIGRELLAPEELQRTIETLTSNPPAPFDLSRKTRVFATRFQFVEFEVQGAEWTGRRMKLSSFLLNADLPAELAAIMETQVRPFQGESKRSFAVPHFVNGRLAYERDGKCMMMPATQRDIQKAWGHIRDRYLHHLKGFGWLIRRDRLEQFRGDVDTYEQTLTAWVSAFRQHVTEVEDQLVKTIVASIKGRIERSARQIELTDSDLTKEVRGGLDRLRVIDPKVRIVIKNVSWESTRDQEFTSALKRVLPKADLADWFEEFTAARQRAGRSH